MTPFDAASAEIIKVSSSEIAEAQKLRVRLDGLLDSIRHTEIALDSNYAQLGSFLKEAYLNKHWITWGFNSSGSFIAYVSDRIGRERSYIYNVLTVANNLLPAISEADLVTMGISKAQSLAEFVKKSGRRVTPDLLGSALDPDCSTSELRASVAGELHEKSHPDERWRNLAGIYATEDEWQEMLDAFEVAMRVDPPIDHTLPEHMRRKEIFLRWAREFMSSYASEVFSQ